MSPARSWVSRPRTIRNLSAATYETARLLISERASEAELRLADGPSLQVVFRVPHADAPLAALARPARGGGRAAPEHGRRGADHRERDRAVGLSAGAVPVGRRIAAGGAGGRCC